MTNSSVNPSEIRLLLSETIWLESEHFEQAKQSSNKLTNEAHQWQTYLNILASLAFEQWFSERMPGQPIKSHANINENLVNIQVGEFKLSLIATEHLLDEVVKLPQNVINQPDLVSHFYVVIEVLEEEEQVIIRGFLRYDNLIKYRSQINLQPLQDGYYHLPFQIFDPELNHLIFYSHFLASTSIPLPLTGSNTNLLLTSLQEAKNKLSRWLEGVFDESWQTIDALINPEANLAFSTRNVQEGAKRCKLIDMGMQLGNQKVALLMSIAAAPDDKMGVLIQLHPTGGERFLYPDFKLTLLSKAGKILQEVQARDQDNYIQLKPFRGELGKRFSVEVSLSDVSIKEDFEL